MYKRQLYDRFETLFDDQGYEEAEAYFRKVVSASWDCAKEVYELAYHIYDLYCDQYFPLTETDDPDEHQERSAKEKRRTKQLKRMEKLIRAELKKGNSLIEVSLMGHKNAPWDPGRLKENVFSSDGRIDPLILTCQILRAYLGLTYGKIRCNKVVHLPRDENGTIDFTKADQKKSVNRFLLDIGYAGVFAVRKNPRASRLRAEVCVHKALWDLSTRLRGRRFVEIVEENWDEKFRRT